MSGANGHRYTGPNPDVLFIGGGGDGGYHLRTLWPAIALRSRGLHVEIARGDMGKWEDVTPGVVVIHRALDPRKYLLLRHFWRKGSKVLLSEDDAIWWTPPDHPLVTKGWTKTQQVRDAIESTQRCAKEASGVIVTTDELAELYARWNTNVHILENRLPAWVGKTARNRPERERPLVGYRGSMKSHEHDLAWIKPVAAEMLEGADFLAIGDMEVPAFLGVKGRSIDWCPPNKLYRHMATCDLGIVPLYPHRFNDAKSWLAALEWLTLGVPVVATATRENVKLSVLAEAPRVRHLALASEPESFAYLVREMNVSRETPDLPDLSLETYVPESWEKVIRSYL